MERKHFPKDYGLEIVTEEDFGMQYEFDTYMILRDDAGVLYWAYDSGCSCPVPFENHTIEDCNPINSYDALMELKRHVDQMWRFRNLERRTQFMQRVQKLYEAEEFMNNV